MRYQIKGYKRYIKEWKIHRIKSLSRRRYIFKRTAMELIFKEGYSILLNFPEADYEEKINLIVDLIK